jgi:transcriptional regulator with XRE-family HTH domain
MGLLTIARLLQFARREARQTPDQYAKRIGIAVDELETTEAGVATPEPRVLFAVSESLKISYQKLMTLAGHRQVRDAALEREALRFAAFSAPMDKLSSVEAQALHDLLRLLHD